MRAKLLEKEARVQPDGTAAAPVAAGGERAKPTDEDVDSSRERVDDAATASGSVGSIREEAEAAEGASKSSKSVGEVAVYCYAYCAVLMQLAATAQPGLVFNSGKSNKSNAGFVRVRVSAPTLRATICFADSTLISYVPLVVLYGFICEEMQGWTELSDEELFVVRVRLSFVPSSLRAFSHICLHECSTRLKAPSPKS